MSESVCCRGVHSRNSPDDDYEGEDEDEWEREPILRWHWRSEEGVASAKWSGHLLLGKRNKQ